MKCFSSSIVISVALTLSPGLWSQVTQQVPSANHQDGSLAGQTTVVSHEMNAAIPPVSAATLSKISAGDILEINVYGAPDLAQRVRVSNAGSVYLPLLDYVHVDGLTVDQAQELIEKRYKDGGFLVDPHVSVAIAESVSGVFIRGQVAKPGVYPVLGSAGLLDVISSAGGLTAEASDIVTVTHREHPDKGETLTLSDDPDKSSSANVPVYQGDTVFVPRAGIIYVVGEVQSPAGLALKKNTPITATKALAMVHGPSNNASLNNTFIIRKTSDGQQQNIPVPLGKILKTKAPDVMLQPNDILYVPNSRSKAVAKYAVGAAIAMGTALSIVAIEH